MDLGLAGRRALVGGGASGIGNGIATALAGEGARVALIGRTADRVEAEAARLGGVPVVADLATPGGPLRRWRSALAAMGGLDLVVVNTGGPPGGTFETLDEAAWETAINGTLQSVLRLIRAALPALREGVDPSILIVLSSSVREPIPSLTTSNVLRPGLAGLVKTLTAEIAPIRINGIAPGRIATERIAYLDGMRARRPASHPRRSHAARRRPSRWAGTATSPRSVGWGRSCSRRRRRSSRARSCRSTEGWSARCRRGSVCDAGPRRPRPHQRGWRGDQPASSSGSTDPLRRSRSRPIRRSTSSRSATVPASAGIPAPGPSRGRSRPAAGRRACEWAG